MALEKLANIWLIKLFRRYWYDLVVLKIRNKKISFKIETIFYDPYIEVRDLKISIINYYLNNCNFSISFKNHLFNHLFIRDQQIYNKTCIVKFLLNNIVDIREISTVFLSKEDFKLLKFFNLKIDKVKSKKIKRFILNSIYALLTILSNIQRHYKELKLFPQKNSNFDSNIKYFKILRAWVNLAENIYLNQLNKSLDNTIIHVNPGYLRELPSKRQEKYIKHLKEKKRNYFFYVPKLKFYNILKKTIKIYFNNNHGELKIPLINIIIQRNQIDNYIEYLLKEFPKVKKFYTKEEFHPGTTYLTEKLQENNIKVINFAHGNGVYCPFVNYDVFYVYSKMQKSAYFGTTKFKYFPWNFSLKLPKNETQKSLAILFIAQNIFTSKIINSSNFKIYYKKVLNYIEKLAEENRLPVFVKYHPNSKEEDKVLSKNIKVIEKIEDIVDYRCLALTFYSSYAIELLNQMPFIYINLEEKIDLKYLFPSDKEFYAKSYQDLRKKIKKFLINQSYYFQYWNKLIQSFKET